MEGLLFVRGMVKCLENMKWHFNTNAADEIFYVKEINLFVVLVGCFRFSDDNMHCEGFSR